MTLFRTTVWVLVTGTICVLSTGCGQQNADEPASGQLMGKISWRGKKIPTGNVVVRGGSGETSGPIVDGMYFVEKAPVGKVTIGINFDDQGGGMFAADPEILQRGKTVGVSPEMSKLLEAIKGMPPRYMHPKKSGISTTVKEGEENEFNLELPLKK